MSSCCLSSNDARRGAGQVNAVTKDFKLDSNETSALAYCTSTSDQCSKFSGGCPLYTPLRFQPAALGAQLTEKKGGMRANVKRASLSYFVFFSPRGSQVLPVESSDCSRSRDPRDGGSPSDRRSAVRANNVSCQANRVGGSQLPAAAKADEEFSMKRCETLPQMVSNTL